MVAQRRKVSKQFTCRYCRQGFTADVFTYSPPRKYCSTTCDGLAQRQDPLERFWRHVDRTLPDDVCWPWRGRINPYGYGATKTGSTTIHAHRLIYLLLNGSVQDGYHVDHTCHNADLSCPGGVTCLHRRCVNPSHLEAVPGGENTRRGHGPAGLNIRRTHCVNGHPFDAANTYTSINTRNGRIRRHCRACTNAAVRRYQARKAV